MPSPFMKASRLETPLHDSGYEEPCGTVTCAAATEPASSRARGMARESRNPDPAM